MSKKSAFKIIVGFVISFITVAIIVNIVDLNEVLTNMKKLTWQAFALLSALYLIGMILRTYRWLYLIRQKPEVSFGVVFKALVYGYMLNQLLPVKMGEFARAEYLVRKSKVSRSFLIGTIVGERVYDMIIILLFFGISVLFSQTILNQFQSIYFSVLIVFILGAICFYLLLHLDAIKVIAKFLPRKIETIISKTLENFSTSFLTFKSFKSVLLLLLISLLIWILACIIVFIVISVLDIKIPIYAYFFIVSASTFGMIIPSTSANVGVYHAVSMGALMLFMVPKEQALSFAILAHAFDFFPAILLGLFALLFRKKNS
jgi:glycosyltransferase 2 family protein